MSGAAPEPALLLVGCGPGRSGGDTVRRLLAAHPSIRPLATGPALAMDSAARLIPYVEDSPRFLPRQASVAFREFVTSMSGRFGGRADDAVAALRDSVVTGTIHIEAYGPLPLVRPEPRSVWLAHLGRFFHSVAAASSGEGAPRFSVDGFASDMLMGDLLAGMSPRSRLVSVLRHPAIAAVSLSESRAIGRPLAESVRLVRMHYERWLSSSHRDLEIVLRFEDVLTHPEETLADISDKLGLDVPHGWTDQAAQVVRGWTRAGRFRHDIALDAHNQLQDIAGALGYRRPSP